MKDEKPIDRAREDERQGKAATTQAGEFIREEMRHIREGQHGADSPQQAVAIGLSKARRAGVKLGPPRKGRTSAATRKRAARDVARARGAKPKRRVTAKRRRATLGALKRKPRRAASRTALARQGRRAAKRRSPAARRASARKAARTRRRTRR
jgi:hypothetical protein